MKEESSHRIVSAINVLEHLLYECPSRTELIETQIASLEKVLEDEGEGFGKGFGR
jgi:hypothetical protein